SIRLKFVGVLRFQVVLTREAKVGLIDVERIPHVLPVVRGDERGHQRTTSVPPFHRAHDAKHVVYVCRHTIDEEEREAE
ncbi:hypothetical protein PENTCL1PPCAC_8374, partial [Pristionchus entomophagus]